MAFSYGVSVILLAFAIFGLWCFVKEIWDDVVQQHLFQMPKLSVVILVKNIEDDIEEIVRHTIVMIEESHIDCDLHIIDSESEDLTYPVLSRLDREFHSLHVYQEAQFSRLQPLLLACDSRVIHLIDTVRCIAPREVVPFVGWLMHR